MLLANKITLRPGAFVLYALFFCSSVFAAEQSVSLPPQTELIKQEKNSQDKVDTTTSQYCSSLSKEEILKFYRKVFLAQSMQEVPTVPNSNSVVFERYPFLSNMITFTAAQKSGQTCYFLEEQRFKKIPILPSPGFTAPQKLDFMPTLSQARQFVYSTYWQHMIGVWYLSHSDPDEVCAFYLKDMPSFGWQLTDNLSNQGTYNFYQWFQLMDPFSKAVPMLKARDYEEFIPPLGVRGKTLTFTQGTKTCTITMYKFDDIVERARTSIWDASVFSQYGSTIIGIFYFPEKSR